MADASAERPAPSPATVADVMQPPVTTVEQNDHVAAAAYLMKHANATALIVTQAQTGQPVGIITDADVSRAVADGKNPNDVRIYELMTLSPTVVSTTASIRDAAELMTSRRFRHLPVVGDAGLVGIVDITDVCRGLLESGVLQAACLLLRPVDGDDEQRRPSLGVPLPDGVDQPHGRLAAVDDRDPAERSLAAGVHRLTRQTPRACRRWCLRPPATVPRSP
jgi:CBS domain-containing protein